MASDSTRTTWRLDTVFSAAALALSAAGTAAWLAGWVLPQETLPMRAAMLVGALIVSGGLLQWLLFRLMRQEREARRYLELLSLADDPNSPRTPSLELLPKLRARSPWRQPLSQLTDALARNAEHIQDVEHARAALEIRCRRSAADFARVSSILGGVPEPVVAVDAYDEIILANAAAQKLLGIHEGNGRSLSQATNCARLAALVAEMRRRRTRTQRSEEIEIERPGGERSWYNVTVTTIPHDAQTPERDSEGLQGAVAVLRDISAQRNIQRRHAEFVSSASHEMRTPLAGIKAYVELLADGDASDEETREEFLGVINGQTDRLQRLIDNLLNLARIEAGVVKVSKQTQSLNEILGEAFHVVQPSAEAKQLEFVSYLSPMYLGVLVDRDLMLQTAINLLSNAIKYTQPGGRVTLRSRMLDQQVQFEVEDTGVGLSAEDCERVFDKFYRVEKDQGMAQGTGLGLPLAKYIAEDVHGGKLGVQSELGRGSVFSVTIPAVGRSLDRTGTAGPQEP